MKTAAFVTYNTLNGALENGWHQAGGHRALLLQNTKGERWAVKPGDADERLVAGRSRMLGELWRELKNHLHALDHLVIYLGANGCQRAISFASFLPQDRVTFVMCECSGAAKESALRLMNLEKTQRIWCECGGHNTMRELFERFLKKGEVGN